MGQTITIGRYEVEVTSLDKVMFPDDGLTKGDLIDYYQRIAGTMVPHVAGRPLTMHRFPNGIGREGFYQKEAPDYFPGWIDRVAVEVEEGQATQHQVLCNHPATLVYLANQGCITPHVWLSRADKLPYPDKLIFDLDPPGGDFESVRAAALALRQMLQEVGLVPFAMTTGSKGLHIVTPLERSLDFDSARAFARRLAEILAGRQPDRFTTETRKNKRRGRLFLDYLRNAYGQHGVAPYAVRAKAGAPIATPLDWGELAGSDLHSQRYTMRNIFRRLGQKEDPWRNIMAHARSLPEAQAALDELQ